MNHMRKLMETIKQLNEGWDVNGISRAIYDEIRNPQSPVSKAWHEANEPYRAAIYTYGRLSRLFDPDAIDGSEIYHAIVDALEELTVMGEDASDGREMFCTNCGSEEHNDPDCPEPDSTPDSEELEYMLKSIAGDNYFKEAFGDDPDPYASVRSAREITLSIYELMDEGILDPRQVADAALRYMSEADVADMARQYEWLDDE